MVVMAALRRKASIYIFVILLTLFSLFLVNAQPPKALSTETIYVDGSNVDDPLENGSLEHPYTTVQEGVDAASVGGTVQVASGTYYENVVLNKSLTLKGASSDITIIDGGGPPKTVVEITADNVEISGFAVRNGGNGIRLYMCNGTTLSNNAITLNNYDGISLEASSGNTISGNTITSNDLEGIVAEDSNDNLISGNTITNNKFWGVDLISSDNNTIFGNTIASHTQWFGISLENSRKVTISGNILSNNGGGVELGTSSGGNISGNTFSNNEVGVELSYSGGNTFYHNNFISNAEQVISFNSASMWNNSYPSGGNYWSNYEGNDAYGGPFQNMTGSDGIGDIPYNSTEYEKDYYPLITPYDETDPMADAGSDQLVVNGTRVTFDGSGSTDNLDIVNYGIVSYTWNFTDVDARTLTGVQANYTFDNVGNFSVTLNVSDYSGNWDTDEMWVNVTKTQIVRDVAITSIMVSPTTVTTGESIIVNVTLANEGNMSETFKVTVYYDSMVVGTKNVASLASGDNETLSFNWSTTGVPGGNYTVKAVTDVVDGETDTEDNERAGDKVTIKKLGSIISVSMSPATITIGAGTTISGAISPIRVEVSVTINYRLSEGNWSELKKMTTDPDGRYSYEWTPPTTGTYEVKASWEGDLTHLPAESEVGTVTVKEQATERPTSIYPYAATIIVIIIVSATVVYIIRTRKPKPARKTSNQNHSLLRNLHFKNHGQQRKVEKKLKTQVFYDGKQTRACNNMF